MKKLLPIFLALIILGCEKDQIQKIGETTLIQTKKIPILKFANNVEISTLIDKIKTSENFDLPAQLFGTTKSGEEFTSLRESLINKGLQNFTNEELLTIQNEELIYEPDDYIIDPYFASILNEKREVQVGNQVYRYIEDALLICDIENYHLLDNYTITKSGSARYTMDPNITCVPMDYHMTEIGDKDGIIYGDGSFQEITQRNSNLKLADNITVPSTQIRRVSYAKGNGDASLIQKSISGLFGVNVVALNYFDEKHRMKISMYSTDYIIYKAIGMSVRMQKKVFGIWWRKSAQEFRYGWSTIEVEHSFNGDLYNPLASRPNNQLNNDLPAIIEKYYPFKQKDITYFQVPIIEYNFTLDINESFYKAAKSAVNLLSSYYNANPDKKGNEIGYFASNGPKKLYLLYPQTEEVAYNIGRERNLWDFKWGKIVLSYTNNFNTNILSVKNFNLEAKSVIESTITRGEVYAAVKYNNEWRAAIITKNI
jgi:hypothetical protein